MENKNALIDMTAEIVSAYVGNNEISAAELPSLIQQVYISLADVSQGVTISDNEPLEARDCR